MPIGRGGGQTSALSSALLGQQQQQNNQQQHDNRSLLNGSGGSQFVFDIMDDMIKQEGQEIGMLMHGGGRTGMAGLNDAMDPDAFIDNELDGLGPLGGGGMHGIGMPIGTRSSGRGRLMQMNAAGMPWENMMDGLMNDNEAGMMIKNGGMAIPGSNNNNNNNTNLSSDMNNDSAASGLGLGGLLDVDHLFDSRGLELSAAKPEISSAATWHPSSHFLMHYPSHQQSSAFQQDLQGLAGPESVASPSLAFSHLSIDAAVPPSPVVVNQLPFGSQPAGMSIPIPIQTSLLRFGDDSAASPQVIPPTPPPHNFPYSASVPDFGPLSASASYFGAGSMDPNGHSTDLASSFTTNGSFPASFDQHHNGLQQHQQQQQHHQQQQQGFGQLSNSFSSHGIPMGNANKININTTSGDMSGIAIPMAAIAAEGPGGNMSSNISASPSPSPTLSAMAIPIPTRKSGLLRRDSSSSYISTSSSSFVNQSPLLHRTNGNGTPAQSFPRHIITNQQQQQQQHQQQQQQQQQQLQLQQYNGRGGSGSPPASPYLASPLATSATSASSLSEQFARMR
ncbi:hypothetical protein HDU76_009787, partial [Blyttiomyces sp. JEL0837]